MESEVGLAHSALSQDVRDACWVSNCAGEIFVAQEEGEKVARVGNFLGDTALSDFVVKVLKTMVAACLGWGSPIECS